VEFDFTSEPWCWPPAVVRDLTVWQLQNYRDAQARRVERAGKDSPAGEPAAPPITPNRPPPRELLIRDFMEMGRTRQQAEELYDRQTAAWEASRAKPR